MMSEDGVSVTTVRNPLLMVMQAQAEKEKIRERRRKIRTERRKERERRRGIAGQHGGGHVRPTTYTPPPPLLMPSLGASSSLPSLATANGMMVLGPSSPNPRKISAPTSSPASKTTRSGAMFSTSLGGKCGSNSDSEVGTRKARTAREELGGTTASPAQQLLLRMYQQKAAAAERKAQQERAAAAAKRSPQQDKLVSDVVRRVYEAVGECSSGGSTIVRGTRPITPLSSTSSSPSVEEYLTANNLHEICDWLASLKLPLHDYLEPLVMEGFDDMPTIRLLQEEDLIKHVGIAKTGHRKKIMFWVHRNRPEGYFDTMDDVQEQENDQDDYNMLTEINNGSSSDSSTAT